jgi:flagellar biogenesis protein FliO|tara:strand:+ start:205 stop:492 length:288 start_codon:yes stop_codon:yes gene_type:complete
MSKKILQFIVILLAVLIIICFVSLIVGMYLKIAGNQNNSQNNIKNFSLNLANNEKIIDIQVLNNNQLLIVISNSVNTSGIVYDTKKNNIISTIKR